MTDKELRKLNRGELLEILLTQSEQIDKQKKYIHLLEDRLEERTVMIENAGSIAEATVSLNSVFETAQSAADHYLDNIRMLHEKAEKDYAEAQKKSEELVAAAAEKAEKIEKDVRKKVEKLEKEAIQKAAQLEKDADQKATQIERDARLKAKRIQQDAQSILDLHMDHESNAEA